MNSRFPAWIRRPLGSGPDYAATKATVERLGIHTVCRSARCPNQGECWQRRTATFLILGDTCTRNCGFCSVTHGRPAPVDAEEPGRVADAVHALGIRHVVITSVTRDDLDDGGADQFVLTIEAIRAVSRESTVEALVPDFQGDAGALEKVLGARPDVIAHNIECVSRLYKELRGAGYERALSMLRMAAAWQPHIVTKSALMVGHGETKAEVAKLLDDLRDVGCDVVYMGQYLQPSAGQRPVAEFIPPERFARYEEMARERGFRFALAGPFVRSSYRSEEALGCQAPRKPMGVGA